MAAVACLRPEPVPVQFKPRILTTLIDEHSGEALIDLAMNVARKIVGNVAQAVGRWR